MSSPDAFFGATNEALRRYSARMQPTDVPDVSALVALVGRVVVESGGPAGFDAHAWTTRWLSRPAPALGGKRPMEYMGTPEGRALLATLVMRMQSGAYT